MEGPRVKYHGLCKEERICSVKAFETLLSGGRHIAESPLRCNWLIKQPLESTSPINRIAIAVPKRNFKRAVKRNLLKRRIREAYRLNKEMLPQERNIDLLFVYTGKEVASFEEVLSAVTTILGKINERSAKQD